MTQLSEEEVRNLEADASLRNVYDLRCYVVGGGFQYVKMMYDAGFRGATGVDDADVILFTGGSDVDPGMYGEEPIPATYFDKRRDADEAFIYGMALGAKKPMIGICRGGQFLNVMNGGKMWQDVNGHAIHGTHSIWDMRNGKKLDGMTSTHHQMMIPAKDAEVIALAECATFKRNASVTEKRDTPELDDTEVVWYADSLSLCFQPHPEFSHGPCRNFFLDLGDNYILPAC